MLNGIITPKTIKKEEKIWELKFDDYTDTFYTKSAAESALKDLQNKKKSRLEDFIIAEKLFDYQWVNMLSCNYLINPINKDAYGIVFGKNPNFETDGILIRNFSSDVWYPPDFNKNENFINLTTAILEKGYWVTFCKSVAGGANCQITNNKVLIDKSYTKEHKDHSLSFYYPLVLKAAAVELCEKYL